MKQYAQRECSDCGALMPANELIKYSEKQLSGTTSRSGLRTGVRGGVGFSAGGSQRFRHVTLNLCQECADYRIRIARRARFWANMRGLFILGGITIVVVMVISSMPTRSPDAISTNSNEAALSTPESDNIAEDENAGGKESLVQSDAKIEPGEVKVEHAPSEQEAARADVPLEPDAAPVDAGERSGVSNAIMAATEDALETGNPQRWKVDGKSGYAVPSAAQAYPDRSCRNVYATIVERGSQKQSPPREWCRTSDSSEWSPSH